MVDNKTITLSDRITGEDCFIARAHVRSVAELERLIDKVIPYAMTNTSIIQSSPVTNRLPPIFCIGGVAQEVAFSLPARICFGTAREDPECPFSD